MYERYLRPDELMHYGVKGMHWGVRRYQNPDGTLTEAGARRLGRIKTHEYNNRANYKKYKAQYDSANIRNTFSIVPSIRRKKEERRIKDMTRASRAMSELDIKKRRLDKKAEKLKSHTNKPIEGIDFDRSTRSSRASKKSLNYLEKQRAKQQANANTSLKKSNTAELKGNSDRAKKLSNRGKSYIRNVKEIENLEHEVMRKASEKGQYIVGSSHSKYVNSGRDIAVALLGGPIAYSVSKTNSPERNVDLYRYEVTRSADKAKEYEKKAINDSSKNKHF